MGRIIPRTSILRRVRAIDINLSYEYLSSQGKEVNQMSCQSPLTGWQHCHPPPASQWMPQGSRKSVPADLLERNDMSLTFCSMWSPQTTIPSFFMFSPINYIPLVGKCLVSTVFPLQLMGWTGWDTGPFPGWARQPLRRFWNFLAGTSLQIVASSKGKEL
jgi:hypothetical protein